MVEETIEIQTEKFREDITDELREIEVVCSKSLGEIYEFNSRRNHERAEKVSIKSVPLRSLAA